MNKQQVEIIFAEAVVEVWKERLNSKECSYKEFESAMIQNINLTKGDALSQGDEE